jgi:CBS-domain-containing membrane protein
LLKGKKILAAFLSLTLTMSMFVGMSTIAKAGSVNLALNKTASASSVYPGSGNIASNAFDGDSTVSRWASNWDNNEWLEVDLGKKYSITGAKLVWQYASGENYTIQVSKDNINWTTACTVTGGTNSETMDTTASPYPSDASAFTATVGRYVRMNATLPTTI